MFIMASFLQVLGLAFQLVLDATLASASNRAISVHALDRTSLLKIVDQLGSPLLSCNFLRFLNIVTVGVGERIEAELFVEVVLELLVLSLFGNALLDILPVLRLLCQFLLLLDLSKLLHLVLIALIILSFLLDLVNFLLCCSLSFRLTLLHVLFHELPRIFACGPRVKHGALTLAHLLRQVVVKGHLRQEFILLQILEHDLIFFCHL